MSERVEAAVMALADVEGYALVQEHHRPTVIAVLAAADAADAAAWIVRVDLRDYSQSGPAMIATRALNAWLDQINGQTLRCTPSMVAAVVLAALQPESGANHGE